jgi:hypothetical protein
MTTRVSHSVACQRQHCPNAVMLMAWVPRAHAYLPEYRCRLPRITSPPRTCGTAAVTRQRRCTISRSRTDRSVAVLLVPAYFYPSHPRPSVSSTGARTSFESATCHLHDRCTPYTSTVRVPGDIGVSKRHLPFPPCFNPMIQRE